MIALTLSHTHPILHTPSSYLSDYLPVVTASTLPPVYPPVHPLTHTLSFTLPLLAHTLFIPSSLSLRSSTCCDGFNTTTGLSSCAPDALVCAVLLDKMFDQSLVVDGMVPKQIPTNLPFPDGSPPEIQVGPVSSCHYVLMLLFMLWCPCSVSLCSCCADVLMSFYPY